MHFISFDFVKILGESLPFENPAPGDMGYLSIEQAYETTLDSSLFILFPFPSQAALACF